MIPNYGASRKLNLFLVNFSKSVPPTLKVTRFWQWTSCLKIKSIYNFKPSKLTLIQTQTCGPSVECNTSIQKEKTDTRSTSFAGWVSFGPGRSLFQKNNFIRKNNQFLDSIWSEIIIWRVLSVIKLFQGHFWPWNHSLGSPWKQVLFVFWCVRTGNGTDCG